MRRCRSETSGIDELGGGEGIAQRLAQGGVSILIFIGSAWLAHAPKQTCLVLVTFMREFPLTSSLPPLLVCLSPPLLFTLLVSLSHSSSLFALRRLLPLPFLHFRLSETLI